CINANIGINRTMQTKYLCSIREATSLMGMGRTSVYGLINDGSLKSVKIGSRRLVRIDSIATFIDKMSGGQR
ncbi:MAG: helix-turn-helix domain-containing protein, partial [Anaerolineales bacterium]